MVTLKLLGCIQWKLSSSCSSLSACGCLLSVRGGARVAVMFVEQNVGLADVHANEGILLEGEVSFVAFTSTAMPIGAVLLVESGHQVLRNFIIVVTVAIPDIPQRIDGILFHVISHASHAADLDVRTAWSDGNGRLVCVCRNNRSLC